MSNTKCNCPKCGSEDFDVYDNDDDGFILIEKCVCDECGCQFNLYFKKSFYKLEIVGGKNE